MIFDHLLIFMRMRWIFLFFLLATNRSVAQTTGGRTVFNFLNQSNSTLTTALGGINISSQVKDLAPAFQAPSLLDPEHSEHVAVSFQSLYAGIRNYQLLTAWHSRTLATTFSGGIHYFSYGQVTETDAAGNEFGTIRPSDYVVQFGFSRKYLERWSYGANLKLINSNYGAYRASGIALDAAVTYQDTSLKWQATLLLKNMGAQLKSYAGTDPGDLPFDIQAGVSKRLAHAPLEFSLTAHHLFQYDILYSDTAFNTAVGNRQGSTIDKLFSHFVVAAQLFLSNRLEVDAAYNHVRRRELSIGDSGNGLNGFSLGMGINFRILQLRYARSYYLNNRSIHQVGLEFSLRGK